MDIGFLLPKLKKKAGDIDFFGFSLITDHDSYLFSSFIYYYLHVHVDMKQFEEGSVIRPRQGQQICEARSHWIFRASAELSKYRCRLHSEFWMELT